MPAQMTPSPVAGVLPLHVPPVPVQAPTQSPQPQTQAQVNIFTVHEIGFVQIPAADATQIAAAPDRRRSPSPPASLPRPKTRRRNRACGRGQCALTVLPAPGAIVLSRIGTARRGCAAARNQCFQGSPIQPDIRVKHTNKRLHRISKRDYGWPKTQRSNIAHDVQRKWPARRTVPVALLRAGSV